MTEAALGSGLLLALETSGDVCGVAVLRTGLFIAERTFRHGMHLSERLMGHIDGVLTDASASIADVDVFAVGLGPGSFTGTRIGVMTAKTLAAVLGRPIVGVDGLAALAAAYLGLSESIVVPLLPCRAGVVYTAAFRVDGVAPEMLFGAEALTPADLIARLEEIGATRVLFCGPAGARYRVELEAAPFGVAFGAALFARASAVGGLAAARLASGQASDDAVALVPVYVSPPPITLPKAVSGLPGAALPAGGRD